jgi:DNA-binding FadR family transcriptional regulator
VDTLKTGSAQSQNIIPNRSDEIVTLLKRKITFQEYLPGDVLPNEELLAQVYSVSRASIREALGILKAQGYLESRRGKNGGTFVKNILESEKIDNLYSDLVLMGQMKIEDLLSARLLIEPEAARAAAIRATPDELDQLAEYHNLAAKATTLDERIKSHIKFHNAIGEMSGNPFYAISIRSFMKFTYMFLKVVGDKFSHVHEDRDHNNILQALQSRKPQFAYETMYVHGSSTKNSMMVLEQMFREIRMNQK